MGAFGLGVGVPVPLRGSLLEQESRLKPVFPLPTLWIKWLFVCLFFPLLPPLGKAFHFFFPWPQQMRQQFPVFLLAHLEGANDQQELN